MKIKNKYTKYKKSVYLMLCILFVSSSIFFVGCSQNKDKDQGVKLATDKNNSTDSSSQENKLEGEKDKSDTGNTENEESNNDGGEDTSKIEENKVEFVKHQLSKNAEAEFGTTWENSNNKKLSACIEGKGPDAGEEGIGKIYVKDLVTGEKWSLEIIAGEKQNTPKSIEWIDDENIISIVGFGYGTVAMGGDVYRINVKTGETKLIYDTKDSKKEVISVEKVDNKLELQILVYDDDEYIKNHTEKKVIDLQ